jgi:hypothetical protein
VLREGNLGSRQCIWRVTFRHGVTDNNRDYADNRHDELSRVSAHSMLPFKSLAATECTMDIPVRRTRCARPARIPHDGIIYQYLL